MTDEWQAIATAPKDGKWILITEASGTWMDVARWYEGCWCSYPQTMFGVGEGESPASHWMELPYLPEPPK